MLHKVPFGPCVAVVMCALSALSGSQVAAQDQSFDILIENGRIYDGTGNPWYYGDLGIKDGRIVAIGMLDGADAVRTIDAEGLAVAPGFIDLHTHTELFRNPLAQSKIRQGVTVDVIGEGSSVAPRDNLPADPDQPWSTFTEYFDLLESQGISMNIISMVSEGQVRRVVMGYETRAATPDELRRMTQLVDRSLREGAWGLMTRFESGGPPHPDEVVEMAKVAGSYGSVYFSHIGSEGFEQQKELDFVFRVAEEAQMPAHILHLKIRGQELWDQIPDHVAQINAARLRGLDITADQYPYTAMHHSWGANFPLWMREDGPEQFAIYLKDKTLRERIKTDPEFIAWSKEHGWWEGIAMAKAQSPEVRVYEGMRVAEIAALRGDTDPADTIIELMAMDSGRISGVFHNQSEFNIELIMRQPWVSIASDGGAIDLSAEGVPHPRNYGTNVRVLGRYVRERNTLALEDAVRKMTSLPAQILGLRDRGQLAEGYMADVVVFDPATVSDTNSYEEPKSYAQGVPFVLVNGVVVIDDGEHTGARPGKALRGPAYQPKGG